jgi:hypothetical protein
VRLVFVWAIVFASLCFAADTSGSSVALRGKLVQQDGKAFIETAEHKRVQLEADEPSTKVLNDARLNNSDFEVRGHYAGPDQFQVDPFEKRALHVYVDGKPKVVSYWCNVCYIRTYVPGKCWCCQKETDLDPQDPDSQ